MLVNGLPLPPVLLDLIASDRWRIPPRADMKDWERVLRHGGLSRDGRWQVRFFSIAEMEKKTSELSLEAYPVTLMSSLGSQSMVNEALSIDPINSVVIADLMHIPDNPRVLIAPVVFDYRKYSNEPRVLMYPDDALESYWREIAANIDEFAVALGL